MYLDLLGLNINYANKGIGSLILKKAKEIVHKNKMEYLRLFVVTDNYPATKLHQKTALWGGFGILLDTSIEDYENSWYEFSKICDKEDVDSEIDTHSCLDMGLERLSIIRNITNSVYNPFIIGKDGYKYYEKQFYNLLKMHKHKKKVNS